MKKLNYNFIIYILTLTAVSVFGLNGDMGKATQPLTDGTADYPYLIEDKTDFQNFADVNNAGIYWAEEVHTKIMVNISLSGKTYKTAIISPDPISNNLYDFDGISYSGNFNGNEFTISNIKIDTTDTPNDYLGLFGMIGDTGTVANLNVSVDIYSDIYSSISGGISGANSGRIHNCITLGKIVDNKTIPSSYGKNAVGGICGKNYGEIVLCNTSVSQSGNSYNFGGLCGINYGLLDICFSKGSITNSQSHVGGLCGKNDNGTIYRCYATGDYSGESYLGGLCGVNYDGYILNCYATGSVTSGNNEIGGLCGHNSRGTISNCYATGTISGTHYLGGLCGVNYSGIINNCYSTGAVSGDEDFGGICGLHYGDSSKINNSFWDIQTSGTNIGYNIFSTPGTVTNVAGKTTAQMQNPDTYLFSGWDLAGETDNGTEDIWIVYGYPQFEWPDDIPSWIDVPEFTNMSQTESETFITQSGFTVGEITYLNSDTIPEGIVINQYPSPDYTFPSLYGINLVLSIGPWPIVPDLSSLSKSEAQATITDAGLTAGYISFSNDDAIDPNHVISQSPEAGTTLATGSKVNFTLSIGPYPIVPDLSNLTEAEAMATITNVDLSVGYISYRNDDYIDSGYVISQNPSPGTAAATGSGVGFIISLGLPTVPEVVSMTEYNGREAIIDTGLAVGGITYINDDNIESGVIISQNPISGTRLASGSLVNLVVSLGAWKVVPDVVNMTEYNATSQINHANLTVGEISYAYDDIIEKFRVISQDPTPGTIAATHSEVNIVISLGSWPRVPAIVNQPADEAITAIKNAGLEVGEITYEWNVQIPEGQVFNQSPEAGSAVVGGTTINCTVSLGIVEPLAGSGTKSDPYLIQNMSDFEIFSDPTYHDTDYWAQGVYSRLTCDINLLGRQYTQAVIAWCSSPESEQSYKGIFLGNGHTVSNMLINEPGANHLGLFGITSNTAQIQRLTCDIFSINGAGQLGGLCGSNYGNIDGCCSIGMITGDESSSDLGGLCGSNSGTIVKSYANTAISGNANLGGLCGYQYGNDALISNSFWDSQATSMEIGFNQDQAFPGTITNVQGKTTIEMQTKATYTDAGWDFQNVWGIGEGQTYPYLRQYITADINEDSAVDLFDLQIQAENWLE